MDTKVYKVSFSGVVYVRAINEETARLAVESDTTLYADASNIDEVVEVGDWIR